MLFPGELQKRYHCHRMKKFLVTILFVALASPAFAASETGSSLFSFLKGYESRRAGTTKRSSISNRLFPEIPAPHPSAGSSPWST